MKTITSGIWTRTRRERPALRAVVRALRDYEKKRMSGCGEDQPKRDFPSDGKYSGWIEDAAKRTSEYKYWYITYTEGAGDRAWMEECDRNYVFRLLREGTLDEKEPKLEEEVPSLFADVQLARRILEQEQDFVGEFLAQADEVDFATLKQTITQEYQQLRQRHLPEQEEVIKRLPDLKPLDLALTKVLQSLKANRSLRSLSLAGQQLQLVELQTLVQLIAHSQTLKKLNLSGVKFSDASGRLLLNVIQHNHTITELDITETDLKPSIVARLKVQLKRNAKGGEYVFLSDDTKAGAAARTAGSLGNVDDDVMINLCRCAKSGKLMLDPVLAADGETYEREEIEAWFAEHDEIPKSPKTGERLSTKELFPCLVMKRQIAHIFELNPKLWEGEEIYVSAKLQKQLIEAVTSKNATEVERIVAVDRRFLTRPLAEDRHLLNLSLASSPEVVAAVISALGDKFWELPEISDDEGVSFFTEAVQHLGAEGAALIARQLEWQQSDIQQQFTQAVAKEYLHLAGVCLDLGADIEKVAGDGSRFIHRALKEEKHELLHFLIERGADRTALDGDGFSTLHRAVVKGNSGALDIIIKTKEGLNIDHANGKGLSALHIACEAGNLDIATKLLEAGANPEVPMPPDNDTALIAAVRSGKLPIVEFLVSKNADLSVANRLGKTALHICAELEDEAAAQELAEYLIEKGVNGHAINEEGKTAKEVAIQKKHLQLAETISRKMMRVEMRGEFDQEVRKGIEAEREKLQTEQELMKRQMAELLSAVGSLKASSGAAGDGGAGAGSGPDPEQISALVQALTQQGLLATSAITYTPPPYSEVAPDSEQQEDGSEAKDQDSAKLATTKKG